MKKFNTKKFMTYALITIFVLSVFAVGVFAFIRNGSDRGYEDFTKQGDLFKYTFERSMEVNGEKINFKESGDEKFRYYHDENGNVLLRDDDSLTYATLDNNGKVISTGVSVLEGEAKVETITVEDINLSLNPELLSKEDRASTNGGFITTYGDDNEEITEEVPQQPLFAGATGKRTIVNFVILIKFNDTLDSTVNAAIENFDMYFNGVNNSLRNYYEVMSNHDVTINSILPRESGAVYVHNGGNRQDYNIKDSNTATRRQKESELLTGAINATKNKFDLTGKNVDINNDGYVDSVSFLICGSNESTWGGLLWPHSWNLDGIDGSGYSTLGGAKVGDYSFNFSTSINTGILCHEMGHVLGAPDFYHYNYDYVPVGRWDLMAQNTNTPQYMLTYTRDKYVGGILSSQIVDVVDSGVYSLKPVAITPKTEVLSYRITLNERPNEYFMVEYRNPTISSSYDAAAPGTGLIVYRVREPHDFSSSVGNRDARFQSSLYPDEVHVFRPKVDMISTTNNVYNNSAKDVARANLSPHNAHFSRVGSGTSTTKYEYTNIFYSDGVNSKIEIEALSVGSDLAMFRISLPTGTLAIPDNAFDGKITAENIALYNGSDWSGVQAKIRFADINLQYLANVKLELLDNAYSVINTSNLNLGEFKNSYTELGQTVFDAPFVVNSKGNMQPPSVFYTEPFESESAMPTKLRVTVINAAGKQKVLGTYNVEGNSSIWSQIIASDTIQAKVFAGPRISVGINNGGTVVVSGDITTGIWEVGGKTNVLDIAVGRKHLLALKKDMTVTALGDNFYGETVVDSWYNVKQVVAGSYTSYGLANDGTVLSMGLNDFYQLNVSGWKNIVSIAAGARHVVGLDNTGKVFATGDLERQSGLLQETSVAKITAGDSFSAVLRTDGTVGIYGEFNVGGGIPLSDALASLTGATNIVAGSRHLLALMPNGTVKAIGDTSSSQCEVSGLYDIIDMAASEHHNVFLREDGVVEFTGIGVSQFGTNNPMVNLIYPVGTYVRANSVSNPDLVPLDGRRIKVGTTSTISVDISPASTTYQRVIYTSSNESVIRVDMLGEGTTHKTAKLTALSVGTAEITARINGTSISKSITITTYEDKPLTGIAISQESVRIATSKSVQLEYSYIPFDATNVGTVSPTFTSSAPDIVSVDSVTGRITAQSVGEAIITVSITIDDVEYTDTCAVTVVSAGVSITVKKVGETPSNPIALKVKQNESINPDSLIMTVTIGAEAPVVIPVTPDMITCDTSTTGTKNAAITYQGASAVVSVIVSKYVTFVEFTEIPKSNYLLGEALSIAPGERGKIKITYSDNTSTNHDVQPTSFQGYNSEKLGRQTLTYRVPDPVFTNDIHELKHNITVSDWVENISFSPRILAYPFGEDISVTEQVVLSMRSGNERLEDFDSPNLTIEGYNKAIEGYQSVVVKYNDTATGNELTTTPVNIEVLLEGEVTYKYKDQPGYIHYFEVTKDFSIDLEFVQNQGKIFKIGAKETTPDIWFRMENFNKYLEYDASNPGTEQISDLVIYIQRYEDGVLIEEYELSRLQITLRGLSQSSSWGISKKDPANPSNYILLGEEDITTFKYTPLTGDPKPQDLRVRRSLQAGGIDIRTPMEMVYDPELINVVQPLGMRYLNEWKYTKIKIIDTPKYIHTIENQTISYNGKMTIDVYVEMTLRGKVLVSPSTYSIKYEKNGVFIGREKEGIIIEGTNYNTTLGEIKVTVEYAEADYTGSKEFILTVLDVFKQIRMIEEPRIDYWYGEEFNPQSAKFEIEYESGAKEEEYFDAGSPNYKVYPEMNGANVDANGQAITLQYRIGQEVVWSQQVTCYVRNNPSRLDVNLSKFTYLYNESLAIQEVRLTYANGENNRIGAVRYSHNYDKTAIGTQNVVFTYREEMTLNGAGEPGYITVTRVNNKDVVTVTPTRRTPNDIMITVSPENPKIVTLTVTKAISVEVIDKEDNITIVKTPNQREYQYGQALNILGLKLEVEYRSSRKLSLEGAAIKAANLKINYNPTQVGSQTVTITGQNIDAAVASFGVYVSKDGESVLSYKTKTGITVDKQNRVVAIKDEGVFVSEAFNLFSNADYLTKHMLDKNGSSVSTGEGSRALRTGDRVVFKNADDVVIYDFEVNVFGDANGDGISTSADLEEMAQILLRSENKKYVMDLNGDGKVTQLDLVLFARKFALST